MPGTLAFLARFVALVAAALLLFDAPGPRGDSCSFAATPEVGPVSADGEQALSTPERGVSIAALSATVRERPAGLDSVRPEAGHRFWREGDDFVVRDIAVAIVKPRRQLVGLLALRI